MASVNSASVTSKYASPALGDYYSNYVAAASSMANDPSSLKFGYPDPTKGVQFAFGFPQHPDSFSALSYNGQNLFDVVFVRNFAQLINDCLGSSPTKTKT